MPKVGTETRPVYGFFDFEPDYSTDSIADKWVLEIIELEYDDHGNVTGGEEVAVIVHRWSSGIDNERIMDEKRVRAEMIVDALNSAP